MLVKSSMASLVIFPRQIEYDKKRWFIIGFLILNKFTDNLISTVVNEFAADRVWNFLFYLTLEKYQQLSYRGPWSATYDPRELTFRKADKENLS